MSDVRVPCSTSNLGAGFDCIGIALDLWLEGRVTAPAGRTAAPPAFHRSGTLAAATHTADEDLTWRGFRLACEHRGVAPPPGLEFTMHSEIPLARGLGSSAAALVAGVLLADRLLALELDRVECTDICAAVEGHPDNVAPIVHGGAVLAVPSGDGYQVSHLRVDDRVGFALCVPDFETSTREARALLPARVEHRIAVSAAGKAAALVQGLATADAGLLRHALDDVLHVPFRRTLLRGYDEVVAAATASGAWGATLSGSGSTVIALAPRERAGAAAAAMAGAWERLGIVAHGREATVAELSLR